MPFFFGVRTALVTPVYLLENAGMANGTVDLDETRVRVALAWAAYDADVVRLTSSSVSGFTHLVASRKGLFAVKVSSWTLVAHGFFFGIAVRGDEIFVFECCDQPRSQLRRGRIIRLVHESGRLTGSVVAKGLDNGCHQIDFIENRLHVVDTYNQVILRFHEDLSGYETLTPLPTCGAGRWQTNDLQYVHVNTILAVGDKRLLLLHNSSEHTGRTSQIAVYDREWKREALWEVDGRSCHGMALLEDGTLLCCDSMSGGVISVDGFRARIGPFLTRGLAVGRDGIVVGGSKFVKREERMRSAGSVMFLNRDFSVRAELEVPGAPTEIRRLDGQDFGLSNYLERAPWGDRVRDGVCIA